MHVLMISERIPPHGWGGQISALQDFKSLSANGLKVTLVTNQFNGEKSIEKPSENSTIIRIPLSQSAIKKVGVLGHFGAYLSHKMQYFDLQKIAEVIEVMKPDLIHIQDLEIGMSGLRKNSRIPIVATIRSCWPMCPTGYFFDGEEICGDCNGKKMLRCLSFDIKETSTNYKLTHHSLYNVLTLPTNLYILKKTLENRRNALFYNTDYIVTISNYLKQMLQQLHKFPAEKIQVIYPSAPNFPQIPPRVKDGKVVFIFIGRFTFSKGVINLLEAFREALRRNKWIRLKIFGSGPLDWYIKNYVEETKLRSFISYGRFFPHDFFPNIMKETDVVIVPSLSPEGFGRVALEAMTCGRPVIVNPVGGLAEQVRSGSCGFCVDCNEPGILANKILEVADMSRDELAEIGRRAREYVLKNFDRDTNMKRLIALYEKAVDD